MSHHPRASLVICVLALSLLATGCATTTNTTTLREGTSIPSGQDAKLVAYSVAFGAVVGGVGALINGSEDPPLRRFARGAGWGAAGGTATYAGKWLTGEIGVSESLAYGLPARLVHDAGLSVIENAAHDRPPLSQFASHLAFIRVDMRLASGHVQARLLPLNALAFGLMFAEGDSRLELAQSVLYGTPLFTGDGRGDHPVFGVAATGYALLSMVYVDREADAYYSTAGHELVHALQHHEFARAEAIFRAPFDTPLKRSATYQALSKWMYLDSPALQAIAYFPLEGGIIASPCKYDNWLEREAEAFGNRRPVPTCL
jgi:hypothetical protein